MSAVAGRAGVVEGRGDAACREQQKADAVAIAAFGGSARVMIYDRVCCDEMRWGGMPLDGW